MSDFALELIMRATFGPDYEGMLSREGENPFAFLSRDSTRDLRVVMQVRELRVFCRRAPRILELLCALTRHALTASFLEAIRVVRAVLVQPRDELTDAGLCR